MILYITDDKGRQFEAEVESDSDYSFTGQSVEYEITINGKVGSFTHRVHKSADTQEVLEEIFSKIRSAVDGWSQ